MREQEQHIKVVEKWGRHKGQHDLLRHLRGERITRNESIAAKCYDCCCGYDDGAASCGMDHCPLYPFMPFRDK